MSETDQREAATLCHWCGDALGGGPGGWYSLTTTFEVCEFSPTTFHESSEDAGNDSEAPR